MRDGYCGCVGVAPRSRVLGCEKQCRFDETGRNLLFFGDIFAEKCLGDRKISAERRNYEHCEGNHRPLHFP
jgi:hypothetical protein